MSKSYIVTYDSKVNVFEGQKIISGNNLKDAQNKFFEWLKQQSVYDHLHHIEASFQEVERIEE